MNDLRLLCVSIDVACDTVAESHADGYEHVAFLLLDIRGVVAVHTEHSHV